MLYSKAVGDYIKYLEMTDKSKETIIEYGKELRYINNYLIAKHNCPVYMEDILLEDIEGYMIYKKEKGLASSSRSRAIYILRSFYSYCIKKELTNRNLSAMLEPIKVKEKERHYITEDEFEELVNEVYHPVVKTVIQTMYYTGGRISEILNLEIDNIDLDKRIIHIIKGKGNKDRNIPINDKLYKILWNYLANIRKVDVDTKRFFANRTTGKVSSRYVNLLIKKASRDLNWEKDISSHILRHSFGTNLLDKGASLVSIQKLLGHTNLSITSRYLHQDIKALSDAVNLL